MKKLAILVVSIVLSQSILWAARPEKYAWGDQGDGTYVNPVLCADYSDPDVIRVGKKYYMVASDFHFIGMQMLMSEDMVNWEIVSQIYSRFDLPGWNENKHYAGGSWAPSLRYHKGKFWVYFCTPDEGLFMSTAKDPRGPWTPLHCVKAVEKWEDPCPLWDKDGQAYLAHSLHGAGPIIIHRMSADGKQLLDDGVTVYRGPVAEGPKFYQQNGYYYIGIPEGGVTAGWQTFLRAKNIYGPYESKRVLESGSTPINGPHQGSLVMTPKGEWWFYHFQETHPMGRIVHLQPARWENNWPQIGVDYDGNGVGEPVSRWQKPDIKAKTQAQAPQSSDNFDGSALGLQWQWNHNPHPDYWSLTEKEGHFSIKAQQADILKNAHNILTQKLCGLVGEASTLLDTRDMVNGQRAGLSATGKAFHAIGIMKENDQCYLYTEVDGVCQKWQMISEPRIVLKVLYNALDNEFQFYCETQSADATQAQAYDIVQAQRANEFQTVGESFSLRMGYWKGARLGLYSYNIEQSKGTAHFDYFLYPIRLQ